MKKVILISLKLFLILLFLIKAINSNKNNADNYKIPIDALKEVKDCGTGNINKWDGEPLKEIRNSVRNNNCDEVVLVKKRVISR